MGNEYEYIYYLNYGLNNLATIVLVIACIILVLRKRNTGSIFMLLGSSLVFILQLGSIFINAIAGRQGAESLIYTTAITSFVTALAYAMFCFGVLLFVLSIKKNNSNTNELKDVGVKD